MYGRSVRASLAHISMKYFSDFYISDQRAYKQRQSAWAQCFHALNLTADIRLECGPGAWHQARSRQTPLGEGKYCPITASMGWRARFRPDVMLSSTGAGL